MEEKKIETKRVPVYTARSSCRRCFGRGYIGTDTKTGEKVGCRCVRVSYVDQPVIKPVG